MRVDFCLVYSGVPPPPCDYSQRLINSTCFLLYMIHEQMDICIEMMTYSHTLTRSDFIRLVGCLKRVILLSLSLCSFVCFPAVDYLAWVNDVPYKAFRPKLLAYVALHI